MDICIIHLKNEYLFFGMHMKFSTIKIWQEKTEELREKPVPVPLCPPPILYGMTWAQIMASAVRGWQLTA
jgi:hypothetical protein